MPADLSGRSTHRGGGVGGRTDGPAWARTACPCAPLFIAVACLALAGLPAASEAPPTLAWAAFENGAGRYYDYARALAVDGTGNVYVTGSSDGDYLTVKYGPGGGAPLWVARYNGPMNREDTPSGIAVDSTGSVYVTGASFGGNSGLGGTGYDYATVKYSPAGVQEWASRYNGPAGRDDGAVAVAVDAFGDIVVTGSSSSLATGPDYTTIKYSSLGAVLWIARYDGTGGSDTAMALAVASDGSIYVTGESWGGTDLLDFATVKYSRAGAEVWSARFDGLQGSDSGTSVQVDGEGAVYVAGSCDGGPPQAGGTDLDYGLVKYSAIGEELWTARYDSGASGLDIPGGLAIDSLGNAVVTGRSRTPAGGWGYLTAAYSPDGATLWSARHDASGARDDIARAIQAGPDGSVYVTGESAGGSGVSGFVTIKYDTAGAVAWATRFDGPTIGSGGPVAMALGAGSSLVIAGSLWGPTGSYDFATVKYLVGSEQPPAAPSRLRGVMTPKGDVLLQWQDNSADETAFRVERRAGKDAYVVIGIVGPNVVMFLDGTVTPRTKYRYRVYAAGDVGDSAPSNEISINVPARTAPRLGVSPARVGFRARSGTTQVRQVTLRNSGNALLTVRVLAPGAPFSAPVGDYAISPRGKQVLAVSFTPTTAGSVTAQLRIESDDPRRPVVTVSLTGRGL